MGDRTQALAEAMLATGTRTREVLLEACSGDEALMERVVGVMDKIDRGGAMLARLGTQLAEASALGRLAAGQRVGGYTLVEPISEGGFGVVWKATDEAGGVVAIKFARSAQAGETLRTERVALEAVAGVPGVVRLLGHGVHEMGASGGEATRGATRGATGAAPGESEGQAYLVLEFVDGPTLADRLEQSPGGLEAEEVQGILLKLLDTLRRVHEADPERGVILHGDLTAANVMLPAGGGRPVVLDFGVAYRPDPLTWLRATQPVPGTGLESGGQGAGAGVGDGDAAPPVGKTELPLRPAGASPSYRVPEVAVGMPSSEASDVYQVGLLGYELLTGRRYVHLLRESGEAGARKLLHGKSRPHVVDAVWRATRLDPGQRFKDPAGFARALVSPMRRRVRLAAPVLVGALALALVGWGVYRGTRPVAPPIDTVAVYEELVDGPYERYLAGMRVRSTAESANHPLLKEGQRRAALASIERWFEEAAQYEPPERVQAVREIEHWLETTAAEEHTLHLQGADGQPFRGLIINNVRRPVSETLRVRLHDVIYMQWGDTWSRIIPINFVRDPHILDGSPEMQRGYLRWFEPSVPAAPHAAANQLADTLPEEPLITGLTAGEAFELLVAEPYERVLRRNGPIGDIGRPMEQVRKDIAYATRQLARWLAAHGDAAEAAQLERAEAAHGWLAAHATRTYTMRIEVLDGTPTPSVRVSGVEQPLDAVRFRLWDPVTYRFPAAGEQPALWYGFLPVTFVADAPGPGAQRTRELANGYALRLTYVDAPPPPPPVREP